MDADAGKVRMRENEKMGMKKAGWRVWEDGGEGCRVRDTVCLPLTTQGQVAVPL